MVFDIDVAKVVLVALDYLIKCIWLFLHKFELIRVRLCMINVYLAIFDIYMTWNESIYVIDYTPSLLSPAGGLARTRVYKLLFKVHSQ